MNNIKQMVVVVVVVVAVVVVVEVVSVLLFADIFFLNGFNFV